MISESPDATDYDDADYVPDSSGNSSDATCSGELTITKEISHKFLKDMSLEIGTAHSGDQFREA